MAVGLRTDEKRRDCGFRKHGRPHYSTLAAGDRIVAAENRKGRV